ncbi:MAG: 16S rRNA (uracil(1498)-N(3))-methyltransferase [Candidatus Competibacter sp.]|nr:16S rRNA (uracil(1498)-N(3))-methyltransferase [Candidatus Competibacter sp.]MDG4584370.1 16S rRNA (uracil(1498)-N(3))-methyltransferase [Candidatus Competibacter sp.]
MRVPRLYLPAPLTIGATVPLSARAFNHAVRVLRLKSGAPLVLFDGEGGAFAATLSEAGKREAWALVSTALPDQAEPPLRIVLAQGISRGEKMDHTVQKAVELGVAAIQPLFVERGGVGLSGERLARKVQHWRSIVIGACEQCGRNRLPELREPLSLSEWLAQPADLSPVCEDGVGQRDKARGPRLLLDPLAKQGLRGLEPPTVAVVLLVGSEGGLSPVEIAQARAAGFTGVRLGPRVLRTETAGVAALAALQALWGDWD